MRNYEDVRCCYYRTIYKKNSRQTEKNTIGIQSIDNRDSDGECTLQNVHRSIETRIDRISSSREVKKEIVMPIGFNASIAIFGRLIGKENY